MKPRCSKELVEIGVGVIRVTFFPSGFRLPAPVFYATMFDTVKTEIGTASEKLSHLRRFL
jgi:hypothetical protein